MFIVSTHLPRTVELNLTTDTNGQTHSYHQSDQPKLTAIFVISTQPPSDQPIATASQPIKQLLAAQTGGLGEVDPAPLHGFIAGHLDEQTSPGVAA